MIRGVIVAAVTGGSISLIGYDVEIVARGEASIWNYLLAVSGVIGLLGVWWYMRRLRKQAKARELG